MRAGGKIDETFIEFLVWMIDKPSRDASMLDRQIDKIHKEYNSWDVDMFTFMRDVIKNITINPSENLTARCPQCGLETVSGVQFPDVSQHYSAAISHVRSLVQDNKPQLLDNSCIETAIFGLFRIDIINFIKVKALLAKEFHIQPSEIDLMPAWEYELFIREINAAVKEDNKRNESEMEKSDYKDISKSKSYKNAQKIQQNAMMNMPSMPSMPKMPGI